MEKYEQVTKKPLKDILWHNFLGGIAWGLGATVGVAVILALVGFFISKVNYVPIVGNVVSEIVQFVEKNNDKLQKQR